MYIEFIKFAEDFKIQDLIWNLYLDYAEELEFSTPFDPNDYLEKNKLESYTWENLKTGFIESTYESYMLSNKVTARKIRQVSQPINLNPQLALDFKGLSLPATTNPDEIKTLIQNWLNQNFGVNLQEAVKQAMTLFLQSQPSPQIEISLKQNEWKKI